MDKSRLAKAHSSKMVELYVQMGWTVMHEFRVDEDDDPYEYLLEWKQDGDPIRPALTSN
jgi:hypothetical protein